VYKARDQRLGRLVALKFLRPTLLASQPAVRRFLREARTVSGLNHPHIATIYAIEEEDDQRYLVLEYLPGGTLRERIRRIREDGPMPPLPELARLGVQLSTALAHAHNHGVVHRDVKPSNVLFGEDGSAKVVDFGLARNCALSEDATESGVLAGTIPYMSPEQARCKPLDFRTDVFSLGVVLHEAATGSRPFQADSPSLLLDSIIQQPAPRIAISRPDLPSEFQSVLDRAMAKDPNDRYSSASELAEDLNALVPADHRLYPIGQASTVTVRPRSASRLPRYGWLAIAALLLAVLVLLFRPQIAKWTRPLPEEKQIAVLPFTNVGGEAANEAFCEGLMETMTAKLSQLQQFRETWRVVPAFEVRRSQVRNVNDAKLQLNANLAVTGSVQRFRDSMRLVIILADTRSKLQLRAATLDMPLGDIAALQDGVVLQTAQMLDFEPERQAREVMQAGGTRSPAAYLQYVEATGNLARYDRHEKLERAMTLFHEATKSDPEYALAWAGAGQAHWFRYQKTKEPKSLTEAQSDCARAQKLAPQLVPTYVLLGQIETGKGQYEEAIRRYREALQRDPVSAEAYRGMAKAQELAGRIDLAEETYKQAIQLRPRDWAGHNTLGAFYYWHARLPEAEQRFRRVVELAPDSYRAYRNLGGVYYSMGRYDESISSNLKSIEIYPTAEAYSNLGAVYFLTGRFSGAAQIYRKAIEAGGVSEEELRGNLAEALRHIPGSEAEAEKEYRAAIQLAERLLSVNARDAETRAFLALYLISIGDRRRAFAELERARGDAPDNMHVLFRASLVNELAGRRNDAFAALEAAINQGYSRPEVENHPDLVQLRRDARYRAMMSSAR
jgi:serine/threonine-protein kinase